MVVMMIMWAVSPLCFFLLLPKCQRTWTVHILCVDFKLALLLLPLKHSLASITIIILSVCCSVCSQIILYSIPSIHHHSLYHRKVPMIIYSTLRRECVCCDLSAVAAAALVIQLGMDFMMDSYLGLFSLRVAERDASSDRSAQPLLYKVVRLSYNPGGGGI